MGHRAVRLLAWASLCHASCTGAPPGDTVHPDEARAGPPTVAVRARREKREPARYFGSSVASAGDLDGDGIDDVLVGAPRDFPGWTHRGCQKGKPAVRGYAEHHRAYAGSAWALSGRTGEVLLAFPGDPTEWHRVGLHDCGDRLGTAVASAGDANLDGCPDILLGTWGADSRVGLARLHSGRDGALLHEFRGEQAGDGFGACVASVGDVDLDGAADVIVGTSSRFGYSGGRDYAGVYSGRDGRVLLEVVGDAQSSFGHALAAVGDLDEDSVPDFAVGAPLRTVGDLRQGGCDVFSGKDGRRLLTLELEDLRAVVGAGAMGGGFGWSVCSLEVTGDACPDLLVGSFDRGVCVFSGADGSLVRAVRRPRRAFGGEGFGASVAVVGDLDGDGIEDFAVGTRDDISPDQSYFWAVYSGADGRLLHDETASSIVEVAALGDVDGDGVKEILLGMPQMDRVEIRSGRTFGLVRSLTFDDTGTPR